MVRLTALILTAILLTASPALAHGGPGAGAVERWFGVASSIGLALLVLGVVTWTTWRERRRQEP